MSNPVIIYIKSNLTLHKVKTDLSNYIKNVFSNKYYKNGYRIEIYDTNELNKNKFVHLNLNEEVTILRYKSNSDHYNNTYYYLKIAIGKFTYCDEDGTYEVEKCEAELSYSEDFRLYDVEFFSSQFIK